MDGDPTDPLTHPGGFGRPLTHCPMPMSARSDLLAVIRAYMANDDAAGLADDLLLVLELDEDQEESINDLRTELETAPE